MKHLFYFIGLIPLIYEITALINPEQFYSLLKRIKASNTSSLSINQKGFVILSFAYLVWVFIGLFTFNWVAFLALFMLMLMPAKNYIVIFINSFISSFILLFIILNEYHFKINLFEVIKNLFNF